MKDWYLRFILTVIAACLVVLVVQGIRPQPAVADGVMQVEIVGVSNSWGWRDYLPVEIVGIKDAGRPGHWKSLPVVAGE